jgi:hypothetical protein
LNNQNLKIEDKMPSFHYKVDFSSDTKWMIIVHKKCYGLLLHIKHVLIINLFSLYDCEAIISLNQTFPIKFNILIYWD